MSLEHLDPELPIDESKLRVEVYVRSGRNHEVGFTAVVEIDLTRKKTEATTKLRDVVDIFRKALPITEIKADDREYLKDRDEVAAGTDGSISVQPIGSSKASRELDDIKRNFQKEENGDLPARG